MCNTKLYGVFIGLILAVLILPMLVPSYTCFKTLSGCGDDCDNSKYDTPFESAADGNQNHLNDEWNWVTNGYFPTKKHYKDKLITTAEMTNYLYHKKAVQIATWVGHGAKSYRDSGNKGGIVLDDSPVNVWTGYDFTAYPSDRADGNYYSDDIAGTVFMWACCYSGESDYIAKQARNYGGRYSIGCIGTGDVVFQKSISWWFTKYIVSDDSNTIKNSFLDAHSDACDDAWWVGHPTYKGFYKSFTCYNDQYGGSSGKAYNHIPRDEYDWDEAQTLLEGNTMTVGGSALSYTPDDDGAMLFFNGEIESNGDQVRVRYKRYSGDSWQNMGTYTLTKDTTGKNGKDLNSENLVVYFRDTKVHNSYIQVEIKALDGDITVDNCRLQVFAE